MNWNAYIRMSSDLLDGRVIEVTGVAEELGANLEGVLQTLVAVNDVAD